MPPRTALAAASSTRPILASMLIVGAVLSPLLVGFEPLGSDVDLMYRPIKEVLARGLRAGTIPYWADDFGLGLPLLAESHMAAFYPPNWFFYRVFPVPLGYRLSMWVHFVALAALCHAYAARLGLTAAGRVAAAVGFSLCGFQAIHAVHEPFFTLMPYLPLCLLMADGYAATGGRVWLAGLALALGIQLTIGHFQVQMWTAGLAFLAGAWRVAVGRAPRSRVLGLAGALPWGACIASVQLWPTWELTRVSGFARGPQYLSNYLFPAAHWAQWALPTAFLGRWDRVDDPYWPGLLTTPTEATAYVGVTLLVLACIGLVAPRGREADGRTGPWPWVAAFSFALSTMPGWWPAGFALVVKLPGLGWFRAPARYTLLTSLALVLLAGRGLDRSISRRSFRIGLGLAVALGAAAWAWSMWLATGAAYRSSLGPESIGWRFGASAAAWALGMGTVVAWRGARVGAWCPLAAMTAELACLFYATAVPWGWSVRLPESSPILTRLLSEPRRGLVAGRLQSLPARVGLSPAYPALGISPPPPNYLLESTVFPPARPDPGGLRWQRRLGVGHGVWADRDAVDVPGAEVVAELPDPALNRLLWDTPGMRRPDRWKLVRYPDPFPAVRVALQAREVAGWGPLYAALSRGDHADEAWFEYGQGPPEATPGRGRPWSDLLDSSGNPRPAEIRLGIPARSARLRDWDGRGGTVEHDGTCYLILRRTFYPGWTYRVDDGPARPVLKVDGGLQCIPLPVTGRATGPGAPRSITSRVEVSYRPTGRAAASTLSLLATAAAMAALVTTPARRRGE